MIRSRSLADIGPALLLVAAMVAACSPALAAVAPTPTATVEPTAISTIAPSATATATPEPTSTVAPTAIFTSTAAPTATELATEAAAAGATEAPANLPFPTGKFFHANDDTAYFLFGEDGRWSHHAGSMTLATGEYRIEGDLYVQTKNSHGCDVPMSFRYTFDGKHLHFYLTEESQNDPCDVRVDRYNDKIYILAE
jgi:hypothetical protein